MHILYMTILQVRAAGRKWGACRWKVVSRLPEKFYPGVAGGTILQIPFNAEIIQV